MPRVEEMEQIIIQNIRRGPLQSTSKYYDWLNPEP